MAENKLPGQVMTSRELTLKIDRLICLRVLSILKPGDAAAEEAVELVRREIADGLKRLDHNPGVYKDDAQRV